MTSAQITLIGLLLDAAIRAILGKVENMSEDELREATKNEEARRKMLMDELRTLHGE